MKLNNIKAVNRVGMVEEVNEERPEHYSELSIGDEEERKNRDNDKGCGSKAWYWLNTRGKDQDGVFRRLHQSNFAFYR